MAIQKELSGNDKEGPFEQFEMCPHYKKSGSQDSQDTIYFDCKYRDTNGRCIFETCLFDNIAPPTTVLWYFQCIFCKRIDSIKPQEMKIHLCSTCIKRIQEVEALPVTCRWCGATITSPPSWPFSGLCEECLDSIKAAADYHRV
jgi:hypothetical protein